jgi:hypothetical protein
MYSRTSAILERHRRTASPMDGTFVPSFNEQHHRTSAGYAKDASRRWESSCGMRGHPQQSRCHATIAWRITSFVRMYECQSSETDFHDHLSVCPYDGPG